MILCNNGVNSKLVEDLVLKAEAVCVHLNNVIYNKLLVKETKVKIYKVIGSILTYTMEHKQTEHAKMKYWK